MYRCEICGTVSRPREPARVYTVYRVVDRSIERSIKVCDSCQLILTSGAKTVAQLMRIYRLPQSPGTRIPIPGSGPEVVTIAPPKPISVPVKHGRIVYRSNPKRGA